MSNEHNRMREKRKALADGLAKRPNITERAADAIRVVPRHEFVPPNRRQDSYEDRPLPIGNGQTISAPHMVAIMASELDLREGTSILEVGTGCGYHAAVSAELTGSNTVYSVEYDAELGDTARQTLADTGYGDISVRIGDGRNGWPEHAPFDVVYVTCAIPEFPEPITNQVRNDGTLLAPVGSSRQRLVRATKKANGGLEREDRGGVRFVRMRG